MAETILIGSGEYYYFRADKDSGGRFNVNVQVKNEGWDESKQAYKVKFIRYLESFDSSNFTNNMSTSWAGNGKSVTGIGAKFTTTTEAYLSADGIESVDKTWATYTGKSDTVYRSEISEGAYAVRMPSAPNKNSVKIYVDGSWKDAVPYVYDGGWKEATAYAYNNGWKECIK